MKKIYILTTTLLFITFFCIPCHAKLSPKTHQILYKTQLLLNDKQYAEAASILEEYINSSNEVIEDQVFLVLGGTMDKAGYKKKAYSTFIRGLEIYPKNELLCHNAAVAAYKLKRYIEAGKLLEKTYTLQKENDPETLFQAGSFYYQGEDFKSSARVLQKLILQTKSPSKKWILLAIHALLEDKQLEKTKLMLLKYLKSTPEDSAYWKLFAKLHLDNEQFSKAAAALEIAYRLKRPSLPELENLASIYRYKEAPLLAAETLVRAYGTSMKPDQALKLATLYASAGRIGEAINCLENNSKNGSTFLKKGKLLFKARNFDKAEKALNKALNTKDASEARFYIALCAWEHKDWKKAKEELDKISNIKKFKRRTAGYLDVLLSIETARLEAIE
ncbi:tetratricopeptide repeat protein [Desulfovibrio sp. UCD-KL4C]|uniref:tetratricopeptide repeat protein n=1 Tax=Desulfovibrio sp. UCD-KL4C TaxID=2578120 RepID=UPI0025C24A27|nr:tetratricopeptide repeat protein [Desulfovibrio sp. UCD-KL4C]